MHRYEYDDIEERQEIAVGRSSTVSAAYDDVQKRDVAVKKLASTPGQKATLQTRDCQVSNWIPTCLPVAF